MPGTTVHRVNRSRDGGLTVVGHVWAPPGAARAVVLVHGVGSSSRAYGKLVDRLVAHGEVHARCSFPYYLGQLRHVVDHRLEDVLPRSTVPVVVVRGERDPVAPSHWVETLAAGAPFGLHRTVRGRHHAMDSDPDGVANIVLEAWRSAERGIG